MRLWSIHPKYLDAKGLLAAWRESLLARKVLQGKTRGYRNHPQLERFKRTKDPVAALNRYLKGIHDEAAKRGYHFNKQKTGRQRPVEKIPVTRGQLKYEAEHLLAKLEFRDPTKHRTLKQVRSILPHPLFKPLPGAVEPWERKK